MKKILLIILFIIIITIIILKINNKKNVINKSHSIPKNKIKDLTSTENVCGLQNNSCTAKDDVNNPSYNMKNIIKQSLLLEEHLSIESKLCFSCIVKHFLIIQGLSEEAVWMAYKDINKYPLLDSSIDFYTNLFNDWIDNKKDKEKRLEILSSLRKRRQEMIELYYFPK